MKLRTRGGARRRLILAAALVVLAAATVSAQLQIEAGYHLTTPHGASRVRSVHKPGLSVERVPDDEAFQIGGGLVAQETQS
jgi:hypothetical protein